jgi:predicted TIM-barrel fold metal-dependent hydrolase
LPVQFHVGYGDADLDLAECDPLLLTGLLRATQHSGVPVLLLHNYPFHRHAGYLAQVFPHVFVDVGLATHHAGLRGGALIAETLEITPFGKFMYSSDAFGLAEHYHLGALLFRRGLSDFLSAGITENSWTAADAQRISGLVAFQNARRVYRLADVASRPV